jgi:hypothetical protein
MKHKKLSYCMISFLLSAAAALLSSCNKHPMSAMALGVSGTSQKQTDQCPSSDSGLGETIANDVRSVQEMATNYVQSVQENLRQCRDKEHSLSVDLQLVTNSLQDLQLVINSLPLDNERYEKRKLEALENSSTTIEGHFKSEIAHLQSQITDLSTQHTEYVTILKGINALAALNDNLSMLLVAQGETLRSCRDHYGESHARELAPLSPLVKLSGGGFLLGALGVGGFFWKKMSNDLKKEKKKNDELEDKILETFIVNEREKLLNEDVILQARIWSSIASQNRSTHGPTSARPSAHAGSHAALVRDEGRENAGVIESLNEDVE